MNSRIFWGILMLCGGVLVSSCEQDPDADIANIQVAFDFSRVDMAMWEYAQAVRKDTSLNAQTAFDTYLKEHEAFLGDFLNPEMLVRGRTPMPPEKMDSIWKADLFRLLSDSASFHLLDTIQTVFPLDYPFEARLGKVLKRLKKHFPEIESFPALGTHANGYTRGGDMRTADQIVSLPGYISFGLHYFLGKDLNYYPQEIYKYQRRRFTPEHLELLLAQQIADEFVPRFDPLSPPKLIEAMIQAGVKQYFVQQLLPNSPDSLRLMYTSDQMRWANTYEFENYGYLVDKLFQTDFKLQTDFLGDKGFTSQLSRESAPRIGEYLGWKMVSAFMTENPDMSLQELCEITDFESIFRQAKYKP